jgi:hypothetical protein
MRAHVLVLAGTLLVGSGPVAYADFTPRFHPSLNISRAPGAIHIDGDLDDPGWVNAAVADGFAEVSPVELPVVLEGSLEGQIHRGLGEGRERDQDDSCAGA